jgi:hypothetical protein
MTQYSTSPRWPAIWAVETTRVGSAGLSASYYALLGLVVPSVVVFGYSVPLAAIGLGIIATALDYAKGSLLAIGFGGADSSWPRRLTAGALGLVLFVASCVAVDGVYMKLRSMMSAGPSDVITNHDEVGNDLKAIKAKLLTLLDVPTTAKVRAEMDATTVEKVAWRDTAQCTDFEKWKVMHRDACKVMLALRVKMADAINKGDLEAKRDNLQKKLDNLGLKPVSADPQATALAKVSGLSENFVLLMLAGVLGVALELVSCFGRFAVERPAPKKTPSDALPERSEPEVPELSKSPSFRLRGQDRPEGGAFAQLKPRGPKPGTSEGPKRPGMDSEQDRRKADTLAFIRSENRATGPLRSQAYLAEVTGVPDATLSDWLGEWEEDGEIERVPDGRCKVIAVPKKRKVAA